MYFSMRLPQARQRIKSPALSGRLFCTPRHLRWLARVGREPGGAVRRRLAPFPPGHSGGSTSHTLAPLPPRAQRRRRFSPPGSLPAPRHRGGSASHTLAPLLPRAQRRRRFAHPGSLPTPGHSGGSASHTLAPFLPRAQRRQRFSHPGSPPTPGTAAAALLTPWLPGGRRAGGVLRTPPALLPPGSHRRWRRVQKDGCPPNTVIDTTIMLRYSKVSTKVY